MLQFHLALWILCAAFCHALSRIDCPSQLDSWYPKYRDCATAMTYIPATGPGNIITVGSKSLPNESKLIHGTCIISFSSEAEASQDSKTISVPMLAFYVTSLQNTCAETNVVTFGWSHLYTGGQMTLPDPYNIMITLQTNSKPARRNGFYTS